MQLIHYTIRYMDKSSYDLYPFNIKTQHLFFHKSLLLNSYTKINPNVLKLTESMLNRISFSSYVSLKHYLVSFGFLLNIHLVQ